MHNQKYEHLAVAFQGQGYGNDSVGNDTITAIAPTLKYNS